MRSADTARGLAWMALAGIFSVGCAAGDDQAEAMDDSTTGNPNRVVELLEEGEVVFATMARQRSEAAARELAEDPRVDYVFYDMQSDYDVEGFRRYLEAYRAAGSGAVLVRIPPIGEGEEEARVRVSELLDAGADGIIFPHVEHGEQAALGVELLRSGGRGVWPLDPDGEVVGHFMIEDPGGVANVEAIVSTPGVGIASPGEGSLRSAYDGDDEAVEAAVQAVLAACASAEAVCAKLVSEADVERRIQEGFRVVIASGEALDRGWSVAGREPAGS